MAEPTPLRSLGARAPDATVHLRDAGLTYSDGGEGDVLRILAAAEDVSSTSDALVREATTWAQTYHLHPSRANVVRSLQLPPDARVLEIGAGCGAITRYLGEACALVDALEPMAHRAAVARERTRDLPGVEVFVGELDDVPAEPAYDVVAVIGVLEYVAAGAPDPEPYLAFLRGVAQRLIPGGVLVLAIENQLGVKYLAGAPEDHSGKAFHSVEGYPDRGPARTFSRAVLERMVREVGLEPQVFSAFPDYKMTRVVFSTLPERARSLYYRIPEFPSPDWSVARPKVTDERSLWRTLVEAGLEGHTGNSFLVVAGTPGAAPLWPADVAARFFSTGRRRLFAADTAVLRDEDEITFVRRSLRSDDPPDRSGLIRSVGSRERFIDGEDFVTHVVAHPDASLAALFDQWFALLDKAIPSTDDATQTDAPIDLVPHNLIVDAAGALHVIDIELLGPVPRDQIVRRGVFWLAHHVAHASVPARWPDTVTVRELAVAFGRAAGLDEAGRWVEQALREEVTLQLHVQNGPLLGLTVPEWETHFERLMRHDLDEPLAAMPLGDRVPAELEQALADASQHLLNATDIETGLRAEMAVIAAELAEVRDEQATLTASRAVQLTLRAREAYQRVMPPGSRRAAVYHRLFHDRT